MAESPKSYAIFSMTEYVVFHYFSGDYIPFVSLVQSVPSDDQTCGQSSDKAAAAPSVD